MAVCERDHSLVHLDGNVCDQVWVFVDDDKTFWAYRSRLAEAIGWDAVLRWEDGEE